MTAKELKLQEALQIVLDYKSDQMMDYMTDYAEDKSDGQLRELIARTDCCISELEFDLVWTD